MKLFYKPGACSLASHIALSEVGATFDIEKVDTEAGKTETGRDFKAVNPKGYVPALELDADTILTEGPSILQFIADRHPDANLIAEAGTVERTRVVEYLNYVGSELHKAFSPLFNPSASDADKETAKVTVASKLDYVETLLAGKEYLMGAQFTVADAYLSVVCNWTNFVGIDLEKWPHVKAFVGRVFARPAAQKALKAEGLA